MNNKHYIAIAMALAFLGPLPLFSDGPWKVKKNRNGITVETRKADGYDVDEFKASATLDMPFDKAVEILRDVPNYTQWMYKLLVSKTVSETSPQSKVVYMKLDLPWPARDRDMYVRTTETLDEKKGFFESSSVGVDGYPQSECIRMKRVTITWTLTGVGADKSKTHVVYSSKGDPSGKLPAWICNLGSVDGPYENLSNLKFKYRKN